MSRSHFVALRCVENWAHLIEYLIFVVFFFHRFPMKQLKIICNNYSILLNYWCCLSEITFSQFRFDNDINFLLLLVHLMHRLKVYRMHGVTEVSECWLCENLSSLCSLIDDTIMVYWVFWSIFIDNIVKSHVKNVHSFNDGWDLFKWHG